MINMRAPLPYIWGLFTYRLNFAWTISDGIDHAADITANSLIEASPERMHCHEKLRPPGNLC